MNILLLETDPRELSALQQVLRGVHILAHAETSAQAWALLQQSHIQILIANLDTTDAGITQFLRRVRAAQTSHPPYILAITAHAPDDEPYADDVLRRPYFAADLKSRLNVAARITTLTDEVAHLQTQMEEQASFDKLTNFLNRAGFLRQAAGELERSRRASLSMSLVALDIDNFALINEKFGKSLGDDVLELVATTINEKSRPYDCIGRWAGDEFVIALPGVIGADAEKVAERIIAGVRGARIEIPNEAPLHVQISAGIASILRITANTEVETILQRAREAVTHAKQAGGGQVYLEYL